MLPDNQTATYDLDEIKSLVRQVETRIITRTCRQNAVTLGFAGDTEIVNAILALKKINLYKTMPANSDDKKGIMQDVYHLNDYCPGRVLYIKLQKSFDGRKGVVIQLKEK